MQGKKMKIMIANLRKHIVYYIYKSKMVWLTETARTVLYAG